MARQTESGEIEMERAAIVGTSLEVSRVTLVARFNQFERI